MRSIGRRERGALTGPPLAALEFTLAAANVAFTARALWAALGHISAFVAEKNWTSSVPKAYMLEAIALGCVITFTLSPRPRRSGTSLDVAWTSFGALVAVTGLGAMTIGGTLAPGVAFVLVATSLATARSDVATFRRAAVFALAGLASQIILMVLVIAVAMRAAPTR